MLFSIRYDQAEAMLGNELPREQTLNPPQIQLMPMEVMEGDNEGSASFTLVMVDPDAPSRKNPKNGPWRHWIVSEHDRSPT